MAKLSKQGATLAAVLAVAVASAAVIVFSFGRSFRDLRDDIARARKILDETRLLLADRQALEDEWRSKKAFFTAGAQPAVVSSQWIKDLLALAQSQALLLEKLEPSGGAVFVSFQGDVRQLVRFVYQLKEKDPLSRLESFYARRQEDSPLFSFELMLAKAA